jgi:hypothetical protein
VLALSLVEALIAVPPVLDERLILRIGFGDASILIRIAFWC